MPVASMIELLEAGVHFGHKTQKWNPNMKKYIYGARNGIYIINLQKTSALLDEACELVRNMASKGKNIVFVGTKKQAAEIVAEESQRAGAYFINRRWLGGTLTNFTTIKTRINKLRELEEMRDNGHFDKLPKKEVAVLTRQLEKLEATLGGVKKMKGMPDVLFVIDQKKELIAIKEANKIGIPVIGVVDTNSNPTGIDYVIPANDDAIRSLQLIASKIADAILEGKQIRENANAEALKDRVEKVKAEDAGVQPVVSSGKEGNVEADVNAEAEVKEAKAEAADKTQEEKA